MSVTQLGAGVFTIANYLNSAECEQYIAMGEHMGFEASEINTLTGSVLREDVRNNNRVIFDDPALAAQLFERAKSLLPPVIGGWQLQGFNERMRFYRYGQQEYFKWHKDGTYARSSTEESFLTFLIYLNDGYEGGSTDFKWETVQPEAGKVLVFPHRLLHQGREVTAGVKYVLRTDVMYRLAEGWALQEASS